MDFSSGWAVAPWLTAAVLALVWMRWQVGPPAVRSRQRVLWVLRGCILAALVAIGLNPVHVAVTPGAVHRPEIHVLLDASQSMLLGSPESRWAEGTALLRDALAKSPDRADVHVHRFGQRLVPVDVTAFLAGGDLARPDDADTQLATAFRQLAGRLGREAPASVVVISDGQVRDPAALDDMAALWRRLRVPVHVVPVGRAAVGGDVAIVAAVAPAKVRKQSQVDINVFLRSFGFAGQRTELQLQALDENGALRRTIRTLPVTLQDGVQTLTLNFRTEPDMKRLRLHIPPAARDLAPANNDFPLEMEVDRTKIRVLVVDGSGASVIPVGQFAADASDDADTPYAPLRDALLADPDVQVTVYVVPTGGTVPRRVVSRETAHLNPAFPQTAAELLAYDAIILSDVPRAALNDEALGWIEEWIGKRGGGLVMAGGPRSFGAGAWAGSPLERLLPVELLGGNDWETTPTTPEPAGSELHPIWRLFEDERATRTALRILPEASGRNNWVRVKPQSGTLLADQKPETGAATPPLLAVGAYGRGRTAALATSLSAAWAPRFTRTWGEGDNRHFAKFARNLIYWATETSGIGRRRLVATTDKRFYRPGETVAIAAQAFDEAADRTSRYRVVASLEPRQLGSADLPPCPVKWPAGRPRPAGESGVLAGWGDEIELQLDPQTKDYFLTLPLVEALAGAQTGQAFKLELTAYQGQTQVDSSSTDVQILSDPFEQQNPLPNREFLTALARATGGRELTDAKSLADVLADVSTAESPSTVRRTPLWSRGSILGILLALLAAEWFWRRWHGLA
ncbi:hypothetical protein FRUB_02638 [Fimbriiglobus ruber]|uniref:Putative glutamine amidotransferase domain-containing protein n=1 Tax=Fimbriiglobus ruber TaxID=1908690 RepID=A0A225E0M2_9BACT|nr:hypothetical protein FRUB_02638 [Fimbriiglobus ruber]